MAGFRAFARRGLPVVVAAALSMNLLPGCTGPDSGSEPEPQPDVTGGIGPNCADGVERSRYERFDINDDGAPDWFYIVRCREAARHGRGDQLEVLDGAADLDRPRRLGNPQRAFIHPDDKITIDGCLMFRHRQVFVGDQRSPRGGWRVIRIGAWQSKRVAAVKVPASTTIPCNPQPPSGAAGGDRPGA